RWPQMRHSAGKITEKILAAAFRRSRLVRLRDAWARIGPTVLAGSDAVGWSKLLLKTTLLQTDQVADGSQRAS
ncbi:MAG TPA: hypothetical protein VMZ52_13630, partial [Bryobacteraceae bacterium]|nr:hypothetical protein [Bryobacteraceae bacterium]